jgi:hypothetical protein
MDPLQIPLRDLHLPSTIGWWPFAPAWWAVIVLVAFGLGWLLRTFLRTRAQGAARRHALRQLEKLDANYMQHGDAVLFGTELSELLRRTMLAYAPRRDVAGLTGEAWLAWLDQDMREPMFVAGVGKSLIELPYRAATSDVSGIDVDALRDAVRSRLQTPVRRNS